MNCMCRVSLVLNTEKTKKDIEKRRRKKDIQITYCMAVKAEKKLFFHFKSIQENHMITIPVTNQHSSLCTDPRFLEKPRKAVPKGLMGRHRSTAPFLTNHMLKEFSSALWDVTPITPAMNFQITNTYTPKTCHFSTRKTTNEKIKCNIMLQKHVDEAEIWFSECFILIFFVEVL